MTHAALSPLIGPEFDQFLGAPISEDRNGMTLSVLSALARLDLDPWREATSLSRMPRDAAAKRLTALIDALPREPASAVPSQTSAADLVALLPRGKTPIIRPPSGMVAEVGLRQTHILLGLSAFAIMTLIVLTLWATITPMPESGASPSAPRGDAATTTTSKLDR